jgi:hypothetical protein
VHRLTVDARGEGKAACNMKKIILCVALAGVCVALGSCTSPGNISGGASRQPAPVIRSQGQPWIVNGAVYTVNWAARPNGYDGQPGPHVEIDVQVDNKGSDDVYYPDPSAVYNGDAVALSGWTQPLWGADVPPNHTGSFQSSFPLENPGGTLQIGVSAYAGPTQATGYWTGTVG